jgi:nucleotide-binding universal stress UspA family protein
MKNADQHLEFHRILVPVTGTDADDETMRLACRVARKDKSKLYAMYVITIKRSLPLDAEVTPDIQRAEEILEHVEKIVREEDYEVQTNILQAREVGPTILDEALGKKADLILMGVKYKSRFGQFSMGSIVPYILKNSQCRVMLYSQYSGQ